MVSVMQRFSRKKTQSKACRKVFAEAKVLEKILLHVGDFQTLVLCSNVNKALHKTVNESLSLQRALFLHTDEAATKCKGIEINPLFEDGSIYICSQGMQIRLKVSDGTISRGTLTFHEVDGASDWEVESSWRQMLIVRNGKGHSLQAQAVLDDRPGRPVTEELRSHLSSELTLGELYDSLAADVRWVEAKDLKERKRYRKVRKSFERMLNKHAVDEAEAEA